LGTSCPPYLVTPRLRLPRLQPRLLLRLGPLLPSRLRGGPPAGAPVDVTAIMDNLASQATQKLDWRNSIVDLMKLINLDSSLAARKELAQELNYTGDVNDSASMNIWLHKQVMIKLAENGGKVPDELKH
jgi:Domain of unknown function (DUF3597)